MSELSSSDWSETPASNTADPPDGWPEGQEPGTINNCAREMMSALKKFWGRIQGRYASTGSSNAYVLTPDVDLAAYVTGERYSFRANFANTGSATLNISSLGAKTIKKMLGTGKANLVSGDIQNGQPVTVEYDGTDLVLVTPAAAQRVAFAARLGASQSISASTFTKAEYSDETLDPRGEYDGATNYRYTPLVPGVYRITALATLEEMTSGKTFAVAIYQNGTINKQNSIISSVGSVEYACEITTSTVLNGSTDYVEVYVFHNDTVSRSLVLGSSNEKSLFSAEWVSP